MVFRIKNLPEHLVPRSYRKTYFNHELTLNKQMNKYYTLFVAVLTGTALIAQIPECDNGRYSDPNFFSAVDVENGTYFGENQAVSGGTETLEMDVYTPQGDTATNRPVVLVAFGGSFIAGSRGDVAPICEAFAKMGYVAVANDYRIGFFFPNEETTVKAVLRGMHDMKACVRYLRKTVAEDGNPYGIDPDRIIVGGVSAGAVSALHATYLDEDHEIPPVIYPDTAALGGIEGNSGTPGYSSDVFACYSFSGALHDTLFINASDQPLASVHETGDGVVPYYSQEVSVIGIPTGLYASGSHDIHRYMESLGMPNCFLSYDENSHVGYLNYDEAGSIQFVAEFMRDAVCGDVIDCEPNLSVDVAEEESEEFGLYPNPAKNNLFVVSSAVGNALILDINGRMVHSVPLQAGNNIIDVSALPSGAYLLLDVDNNTRSRFMKI